MEVRYTNSWYDEAAEKEAALNLINSGCALISQHADSYGAPTACQEKGVPNVSYNGSTKSVGATTYLISSRIDWAPYYELMINAVIGGYKITDEYCGGFAEGSVKLTELNRDAFETEAFYNIALEAIEMLTENASADFNVFDCRFFTVTNKNGEPQHLTTYEADVHSDAGYAKDTQVIKTVGTGNDAYSYFQESTFRSAPYFDIIIDGIKVPAAN
jgi:basic membrane protein A